MFTEADQQRLLERFIRYARVATTSSDSSPSIPSTACQLDLSKMLAQECRDLGLGDVSMSEAGVVIATVPGTVSHQAPAVVFNSHVDTSPEYSGTDVNPIVHENYDGQDIVLPGDPSKVIRVKDNPELPGLVGTTVITTDGTTLLGADDKAGIAIIMTAADVLMREKPEHAPVRVVFTVDEEVGRGTEALDVSALNAICGYTLDGGGRGGVEVETFSADVATVTVQGVNIHPSIGFGRLVNATKILGAFLDRLPKDKLSPETSKDRGGFLHPYHIEGGVDRSFAKIILRDFDTPKLEEYAGLLKEIAAGIERDFPGCSVAVESRHQYRNMGDGLAKEPRAVEFAKQAIAAIGLEPHVGIIRGGTDGALMTAEGLPTPNLFSGQHTPHSPLEWASLDEMADAVRVVVEIAKRWGQETA